MNELAQDLPSGSLVIVVNNFRVLLPQSELFNQLVCFSLEENKRRDEPGAD
jgi:hypothetical protein